MKNIYTKIFIWLITGAFIYLVTISIIALFLSSNTSNIKLQFNFDQNFTVRVKYFDKKENVEDSSFIKEISKDSSALNLNTKNVLPDHFRIEYGIPANTKRSIVGLVLTTIFGDYHFDTTTINSLTFAESPNAVEETFSINNKKKHVKISFLPLTKIYLSKITALGFLHLLLIGIIILFVAILNRLPFIQKIIVRPFTPQLYLSIVFLGIIFYPLIATTLYLDYDITKENKRLTSFPNVKEHHILNQYPEKINHYIKDWLPFKTRLIQQKINIDHSIFSGPFSNENVTIGEHYFLFNHRQDILGDYTRNNLVTTQKLEEITNRIKGYQDFCVKKRIDYVRVVYPNKHSVYDDYIPLSYRSSKRDTLSRTEQICNALEQKGIYVISFINEFWCAKKDTILYAKLDTHWNKHAAFIAYKKTMNELVNRTNDKDYKPLSLSDFSIDYDTTYRGDLTSNYSNSLPKSFVDIHPQYHFSGSSTIKKPSTTNYPDRTYITINESAKSPKTVIIFSDSFTILQRVFFTSHFKKVYYFRDYKFDPVFINKIKPDLIINGFVERTDNNLIY